MGQDSKNLPDSKIAAAWGCSRQYVASLRKKGCPNDSIENANKWRQEHAVYGVSYRSKSAKCSTEPPANSTQNTKTAGETAGPIDTSLEASLREAREIEVLAHKNAKSGKEQDIRAYNNARDGRAAAEKFYREELERRLILVPLDEAKRIARRGYDHLIPKLRALEVRLAPALANCTAAEASVKLKDAIEHIIEQARVEYENVAA